MLATALALARRGLKVFPCRERSKLPATARGCKDATDDVDKVREWWRLLPTANIALATGRASGVVAVDVDGLDAESELRKLEAVHSVLPPTVESITARGRHLFFKMPERALRNSVSAIAPGIDIRGDGGFVVVPPSIQPCGKRYAWSVDSASAFAAAPNWLIERIAAPRNGNGHAPPSDWRALVGAGVAEGGRDCALTRLAGHLLRRYVDAHMTLDLLQSWNATHCRPPLPEEDVVRIVNSIAGRELRRRGADGGA